MDDDFFYVGYDLNGDGKIGPIEKSIEMDDFERSLAGAGSPSRSSGKSCAGEVDKKTAKRRFIVFVVFVLLALFVGKIPDIVRGIESRTVYSRAVTMIDRGDYRGADSEFDKIRYNGYKDTDGLMALCEAYIAEAEGDYGRAYVLLNEAEFDYQPPERLREVEYFRLRMERLFNEEVMREIEEKENAAEGKTGTEESDPVKSGKSYYSGNVRTDDDPYDASDYSNPEDFYYERYDDFFDYEEAEEYFEEHN